MKAASMVASWVDLLVAWLVVRMVGKMVERSDMKMVALSDSLLVDNLEVETAAMSEGPTVGLMAYLWVELMVAEMVVMMAELWEQQ